MDGRVVPILNAKAVSSSSGQGNPRTSKLIFATNMVRVYVRTEHNGVGVLSFLRHYYLIILYEIF